MKEGVRVQVLSSFDSPDQDDLPGTLIVSEEEIEGSGMERQLITGIAHDKNEAKITITRVPDRPGAVASIFGPLADAAINVDMIIQNRSEEHTTELQSLMSNSYAVLCLKKKKHTQFLQYTNIV